MVSNNQSLNQLQLLSITFFLLLAFSFRGFFATMSALAQRTGQDDWDTLINTLSFHIPLTSFETITLGFNLVASIFSLIAFVVTLTLTVKEYRRYRQDQSGISQGRKQT